MKYASVVVLAGVVAAVAPTISVAGLERASMVSEAQVERHDPDDALYGIHLGIRDYWHTGPVGIERSQSRASSERRQQAASGNGSRGR